MSNVIVKMCPKLWTGHGYCLLELGHEGNHKFPIRREEPTFTQSEVDALVKAAEDKMRELGPCGKHPLILWVGEQHVCLEDRECQQGVGCYPAHCIACDELACHSRVVWAEAVKETKRRAAVEIQVKMMEVNVDPSNEVFHEKVLQNSSALEACEIVLALEVPYKEQP